MKKIIAAALIAALSVISLAYAPEKNVSAQTYELTAASFAQLNAALSKANASDLVKISIGGEIIIEKDVTVKGNVIISGGSGAALIFENNDKKTGFSLSNGSNLTLDSVEIRRTVVNEEERFVFYTYARARLFFRDCTFNVATLDIPSISYDRVTYCSSADALNAYFENCTFNTQGYFYRGLLVFYSCALLPQTAGSANVKDFTALKIDYSNGKITFPADITVSTDENYTSSVKSGAAIESETTYYAMKSGYSFSFTTRRLKMEVPTAASVNIDYSTESIYFSDAYEVSFSSDLSAKIVSGADIAPGQSIFIRKKAVGIFEQSEVFRFELPDRPVMPVLKADFTCEFGFAMEYYRNCEYALGDGAFQDSPIFIGLESAKVYNVSMHLKATAQSFASESVSAEVTTD